MLSKTVRLGLVGKSDMLSDMTLNVLYVSLSSDGQWDCEISHNNPLGQWILDSCLTKSYCNYIQRGMPNMPVALNLIKRGKYYHIL